LVAIGQRNRALTATTEGIEMLKDTQSIQDPAFLDRLINEQEAAEFLGYTIRALQNWRVRGGGPRFVKVSGRSVRYRRRQLIEWADSKMVSHTSEVA
jgi:predicted DNA-binding transcriptional regulator AlpA